MTGSDREVELPNAIDVECALLGSILLDNACLNAIRGEIETNDLYRFSHRVIFSSIEGLIGRGEVANSVTISEDLKPKGLLEKVGGTAYIASLTDGVPFGDFSFVRNYARILQKKSASRKLINLAENIKARAFTGEELHDLLSAFTPALNAICVDENRALFHTIEDFENTPPLSFAIEGFLQNEAATVIGALAGHSKTWMLLSVAKALLAGKGTRLWGYFDVLETAERVIYLIPESTIGPFGHRLKVTGLLEYVREGRLLVRTLSAGPRISLADHRIIAAVKGAHVMLDTLVRFNDGRDENSAGEFSVLAMHVLGLVAAGARSVLAAHHAPKSFAKERTIALEGVLRGSGDIGAIFATGWGFKQIDKQRNVIHIENVKPRDFQPCEPFQLIGRPSIDLTGDFGMHKRPGECGSLNEELGTEVSKGGARSEDRDAKAARLAMLEAWDIEEPGLPASAVVKRFLALGFKVAASTVRGYRHELKERKQRRPVKEEKA